MGDDVKAGNPEGESEGEIREAQTVFPAAQIKTRGNNVVNEKKRG